MEIAGSKNLQFSRVSLRRNQSEERYTDHGSFDTRTATGDDNDDHGPHATSMRPLQSASPASPANDADNQCSDPYSTPVSVSKGPTWTSRAQPSQAHDRDPSNDSSASLHSSYGLPPLVYDDHASHKAPVDSEYDMLIQRMSLLDTDTGGVGLPQALWTPPPTFWTPPQPNWTPMYECSFNFLGCRYSTPSEESWRSHERGHLFGNTPPRSVLCRLCDFSFDSDNGNIAWDARMDHLASHFRMGDKFFMSRSESQLLFRYLWRNKIINDAEYKELKMGGTLSPRRAHRNDRWPFHDEFSGLIRYSDDNRRSRSNIDMAEPEKAAPPQTQIFSLGSEFMEFVTEELQNVEDVLEVIVVTGTEDLAFVAPCAEYAEKIWPQLGRPLLLSLVSALRPLRNFKHTHGQQCLETLQDYDLGSDLTMSASLFKSSAPTDQLRIEFEVQGTPREVSEIAQIFKWLSAVCRKPIPDKLLCSQVLDATSPTSRCTEFDLEPLEPPLGTGGSGHCWLNMFKGYVLAEGFPIPERESQRGVELPFDVMTLLGLALYPINFGEGIILKGDNTALIPSVYQRDNKCVQRPSVFGDDYFVQWHSLFGDDDCMQRQSLEVDDDCVQWHYLEGDGAGGPLTWDRIKEHCGNIYPSKDFKELRSKRTFVGYFPSANVHLGTRDSGFDKVDFSGAEYDDKTAVVLGNELVGQVGTSVMNFFTAQVSGKLMIHQTAHQRLRGIHDSILDKIRNSKDFPTLLFDVKTKQGWLVPELSATLHMALAWASYQHQSGQVLDNMPFAEARPDGGMAAYDAILRSADLLLPEHIKMGDNNDKQLSVRQALVPFLARIGQIKDQQLQRCACGIKETKDLVGYEFKEIASFEEHLHLRRSKVDVDKSGGWLRLVSSKPEMAVILCSNLEDPIKPASTQRVCPFWQKVPINQYYLTASVSCLRQLAKRCGGEESLRLYNDIYCTPPKKDPGPGVCGTRNWPCCNPLLELSKHPSKKVLRFDNEGALIIGKAVPHTESLRVLWRSLSSGKDDKAQNGDFSVLQSNHQTLTSTVNPPLPQNSVSSGMP